MIMKKKGEKESGTLKILTMLSENIPDRRASEEEDETMNEDGENDEEEGLGVSPEDVQDKSKHPKKKGLARPLFGK